MNHFAIVGAGGHAREIASIIRSHKNASIQGFYSDAPPSGTLPAPWLGGLEQSKLHQTKCEFVVAIGNNKTRKRIIRELESWKEKGAALVSPDVLVDSTVVIKDFAQICRGVVLTCDIRIATGVIVNSGAIVSHDSYIGEYSFIGPGVTICGNVTLGQSVFVGAGATLLPGVTIGDEATIGAGAVVTSDVLPGTSVVGIPAKIRD